MGDGAPVAGFHLVIAEVATFDHTIRFLRTAARAPESGSRLMRLVVIYITVLYVIKSAVDVDAGAYSVSRAFAFAQVVVYLSLIHI